MISEGHNRTEKWPDGLDNENMILSYLGGRPKKANERMKLNLGCGCGCYCPVDYTNESNGQSASYFINIGGPIIMMPI